MPLDADLESLVGGSVDEVNEENEEQNNLLGAGSSNSIRTKVLMALDYWLNSSDFRWRLRITPANAHRFSLGNRELTKNVYSRQLPSTIFGFFQYLAELCPNSRDKAFRLKCAVWLASPYGIMPVPLADDLWFGGGAEVTEDERAEFWYEM